MIILKLFLMLTFLTGVIYPSVTTIIGKIFFSSKVDGSIIILGDKVIGSEFLAQEFKSSNYFHPRPSSVSYSTVASGASNQSATHNGWKNMLNTNKLKFPNAGVDFWTTSGSGLDPEISLKTALSQVPRILSSRGWEASRRLELENLIARHIKGYDLGFLGQPRINVLRLNLDLMKL